MIRRGAAAAGEEQTRPAATDPLPAAIKTKADHPGAQREGIHAGQRRCSEAEMRGVPTIDQVATPGPRRATQGDHSARPAEGEPAKGRAKPEGKATARWTSLRRSQAVADELQAHSTEEEVTALPSMGTFTLGNEEDVSRPAVPPLDLDRLDPTRATGDGPPLAEQAEGAACIRACDPGTSCTVM